MEEHRPSRKVVGTLRELIGELSTGSRDFTRLWASHDVRSLHGGIKRLRHPVVGDLTLTYQSAELANPGRPARLLNIYTAEPGSLDEDQVKVLASWAARGRGCRGSGFPAHRRLNSRSRTTHLRR